MAAILVYVSPCLDPRVLAILWRMYKRRVTNMPVSRILRPTAMEKQGTEKFKVVGAHRLESSYTA